MSSVTVEKHLDVIDEFGFFLAPLVKGPFKYHFRLQRTEETGVSAIRFSAHAATEVVLHEEPLELMTAILTATA